MADPYAIPLFVEGIKSGDQPSTADHKFLHATPISPDCYRKTVGDQDYSAHGSNWVKGDTGLNPILYRYPTFSNMCLWLPEKATGSS